MKVPRMIEWLYHRRPTEQEVEAEKSRERLDYRISEIQRTTGRFEKQVSREMRRSQRLVDIAEHALHSLRDHENRQ